MVGLHFNIPWFGRRSQTTKVTKAKDKTSVSTEGAKGTDNPPLHKILVQYPCSRMHKYRAYPLTEEIEAKLGRLEKLAKSMPGGIGQYRYYKEIVELAISKLGYNIEFAQLTPPWLGRRNWGVTYPEPGKFTTVVDFTIPHGAIVVLKGVISHGRPLADEIWAGVNECADIRLPFDRYHYKNTGYAELPVMVFLPGDHVRIKAVTYEIDRDLHEVLELVGMVFYNPNALPSVYKELTSSPP